MFVPVRWTVAKTAVAVGTVPEVSALYNSHYAIASDARGTLAECKAAALVLTTLDLNQMERDLALQAGVQSEAAAEAKALADRIVFTAVPSA